MMAGAANHVPLRIGVLASGGGTNLQAVIDAIERGEVPAEIVTVVCNNKSAYALERARKHGIPDMWLPRKRFTEPGSYEAALIAHFNGHKVDLILTAGFMVLLDESFTKAFENRVMNIHPSLIPSFCGHGFYGLHVHEAVLAAGVKVTGATVHFATEEADAGPIIIQKAVAVHDDDTPETLQKRVMVEAEWQILPMAVRLFAEGKLTVRDGRVFTAECD